MKEHYLMQYFAYDHLPEHLQHTSKAFHFLANAIDQNHMNNSEQTTALRKLLEAKDAAVRSKIHTNKNADPTVMVNSADDSHLI